MQSNISSGYKIIAVDDEQGILDSLSIFMHRSGYTFKGWYSNGSKVTNSTTVTQNMTVTGEWDSYTFVTSYINNDGQSPNIIVTAYKNGATVGIRGIYGNLSGNAEYPLGKWSSDFNAVRIAVAEQFKKANNFKIQLNDGTRVFASGN